MGTSVEYHKPEVIPRKLDEDKQKAFISSYEKLLNSLAEDEAVLFADAVHPTHAARPVGCGRQRINIHGAVDLQTGQTRMIEVETIDALSTIKLLESIEAPSSARTGDRSRRLISTSSTQISTRRRYARRREAFS